MQSIHKRFLQKFRTIPFIIPFIVFLLAIYGVILLYSAAGGQLEPWAKKQLTAFSFFFLLAFFIALIDLRIIYHSSYLIYFLTILMLFLVYLKGKSAMGATRWLNLGIMTIQPAEIMKIALILMLARFFHEHKKHDRANIYLIIPLIATLLPVALILKQPDLGTSIITSLVAIFLFFAAGVKIRYFFISGVISLCLLPIFWYMLHNYQKTRILTFLNPERDPLGAGYNIIQSKIAIGSGGLFGKGLFSGTQGHLSFLPEYQTDFIFAFLTEELGFIGGVILLITYSSLIIYCLFSALACRSYYNYLVIIGIISLFFAHIFINIAMVMGLLPVVGVPLPLLSYGRTMIGAMLIGFGLIMNMSVNKYENI